MSSNGADGLPLIERPENWEELRGEVFQDVDAYFAELNMKEEEARREAERKAQEQDKKVVPIKPGVDVPTSRHTDTELVPETASDVLFSKLIFDPLEALEKAAEETWLLDDFLPAKGMAFIYGPPGSYKSFLAVDLAMSVATGNAWHGIECEAPGAVLYIAAEGARGVLERQVAWEKHHNVRGSRFIMLPAAVMFDEVLMVQALTECAQRATEALGEPLRMVVIDTMARSFNGDENSAQEVGMFVNACLRFASDVGECLVLVVAHSGKDVSRGIRGSSALKGAADCSFLVTKPGEGQALMKNDKQKDVEAAPDMRFAMEPVSTGIKDRKGRVRKSLVPVLESKGEMADPDNDGELDAFGAKDLRTLVGMVKAAERKGEKITEDDLRVKFLEYSAAEGKKPDAARKAFSRYLAKAKAEEMILKAGANLYPKESVGY